MFTYQVKEERPEEDKIAHNVKAETDSLSAGGSRSLTELVREADLAHTLLEIPVRLLH